MTDKTAIIAGFGLPGRAAAELLEARGIVCTIVETNPGTVLRAGKTGRTMVEGDVSDAAVLKQAGVESASMLVIAIPDEEAAVNATRLARQMNPNLHIITRTHFTSVGIEARQAGADAVIVEEQSVANALCDILKHAISH